MRHAALRLPTFLTALAIVAMVQACAAPASDASWPKRTVRIETMRPATPIGAWVPLDRASRGAPSPSGTAALRMHVDADGAVRQVAMIEGSGNAALDAAAIRAMRTARFMPYQIDGVAVPVTVIAPMRFLQREHVSPDTAPRFGF